MSVRLAVLVSGGGTTLQNLIDRINDGKLDATIEIVVASKPGIGALEKAEKAGLKHLVVTQEKGDVESFSAKIFDACRANRVDLVVLSGFLRLIRIPADFQHRVINIHPSLIPAFCGAGYYGAKVHRAVLDRGVKVSGCTVHFADNEYDHGPIILQKAVEVHEDDTPEALAHRVFTSECEALPEAITLFGQGRLRVEGRRVQIAKAECK